jgi:hypothetical protein
MFDSQTQNQGLDSSSLHNSDEVKSLEVNSDSEQSFNDSDKVLQESK